MRYCPYFCEENVWHLASDAAVKDGERVIPLEDRRVVFVSNDRKAFPMDHQRAGHGQIVVWDYHVVLFAWQRAGWHCWDLDCDRGAPLALKEWMSASFLGDTQLEAYRKLTGGDLEQPRFRVVDADEFVDVFSSDRSHMIDARGRPTHPFPEWERIGHGESNLMRFVDTRRAWYGDVLSIDDIRLLFAQS